MHEKDEERGEEMVALMDGVREAVPKRKFLRDVCSLIELILLSLLLLTECITGVQAGSQRNEGGVGEAE